MLPVCFLLLFAAALDFSMASGVSSSTGEMPHFHISYALGFPTSLGIPVEPKQSQRENIKVSERDDNSDDDLRVQGVTILTTTVPIWDAVRVLAVFYGSILDRALSSWATIPEQPVVIINMGCLQLTINVPFAGDSPRAIPWAFVRNFARNMLAMTRRGFTGTYRMWFISAFGLGNAQLDVEVRLSVCWDRLGCHIR